MQNCRRPAEKGVVLVVDDEQPVREVLQRILEGDGYRVLDAADGGATLAMLATDQRVDLVIADLAMPVMRGEELVRRIRELRPTMRVLYVTGESDRLFDDRPELQDGEAFLDKPFTTRGLLEAVSLLKNGFIREPAPVATGGRRLWARWAKFTR
jgi:two-component system cell cycle sensor histidine kinase/response regulator CckA